MDIENQDKKEISSLPESVLQDLISATSDLDEQIISVEDLKTLLHDSLSKKKKHAVRTYDPPKILKNRLKSFQLLDSIINDIRSNSIFIASGRTTRWFTDYKTPTYRETILSLDNYSKYVRLPRLFGMLDESIERQVGYNPRNTALSYTCKLETVIFGALKKMMPVVSEDLDPVQWPQKGLMNIRNWLGKKKYVEESSQVEQSIFQEQGSLHVQDLIPEGPEQPAYFFQYAYYPPVEKQMRQFRGIIFTLVTTKQTFGDIMLLMQEYTKTFPMLLRNLISDDVPDKNLISSFDMPTPINCFSLETLKLQFDEYGRKFIDIKHDDTDFVIDKK